MTYCYSRELRLLTPAHFQQVFDSRPKKFACRFYTILAVANQENTPRIGFTISKKKVKLAVQRNRVKRAVRESFRLHAAQLPNVDLIFLPRQGLGEVDNAELTKELKYTWKKLKKYSPTR